VGPRRRAVLGTLATVRILRPRGAGLAVGARVPVDVRPVPPPELPRSTGGRAVDGRRGADVIQTGAVRLSLEHDPPRVNLYILASREAPSSRALAVTHLDPPTARRLGAMLKDYANLADGGGEPEL